jgi:uncharacterized protein
MEKLSLTNYEEKIKVFEKYTTDMETQKQKSSVSHKKVVFAGILLLLIVFPEIMIYSGKIGVALLFYAGILAILSVSSIFVKNQEIRNICQVFLLLPILRLVNFSMPTFPMTSLLTFVFIYSTMVIPVSIVVVYQHFTKNQLGINFKSFLFLFPASIFIGMILGQGEYSIIQTVQLITDFSFINLLKLIFVMVVFVGVIEELIYRSILQTRLEEFFGMRSGLIISSLIFGFMNSSYGTLNEIIYASLVGLFIGYLFQKTRSLPFIALIHGFINVFSVGIIPYFGYRFGLF